MARAPRNAVGSKPTAEQAAAAQAEADLVAAGSASAAQADAARLAAELGGFDMGGRTLFVRSVSPRGRRRAGLAFGRDAVPVEVDDLSEEQLTAILADSDHLVIQLDI
jgi:hypothetical protein